MQEFFQIRQALISFTQDSEHGEKIKDYLNKLIEETWKNFWKNQQQYQIRYDLNRQDSLLKGSFEIIKQLGSITFRVQHVKKLTLAQHVTMGVIAPLIERRNLLQ
jgi:hypothetical protein